MSELFRETFLGHTVRFLTGRKIFQYPEERTDFELPAGYSISEGFVTPHGDREPSRGAYLAPSGIDDETEGHGLAASTEGSENTHLSEEKVHAVVPSVSVDGTILVDWFVLLYLIMPLFKITGSSKELSRKSPSPPECIASDLERYNRYSSDDPANPQNWPGKKKAFVVTQIWYAFKF